MKMKGQRGQAIILVLIFLAVGSLAITPALRYIDTAHTSQRISEDYLARQLAADAALEDAIWQILNQGVLTQVNQTGKVVYDFQLGLDRFRVAIQIPTVPSSVWVQQQQVRVKVEVVPNWLEALSTEPATFHYIIRIDMPQWDLQQFGFVLPKGLSYVAGSTFERGPEKGTGQGALDPDSQVRFNPLPTAPEVFTGGGWQPMSGGDFQERYQTTTSSAQYQQVALWTVPSGQNGWRFEVTTASPTETDRLKTLWTLTVGGQVQFQDRQLELGALQETRSYELAAGTEVKVEAKSSDGSQITARSWLTATQRFQITTSLTSYQEVALWTVPKRQAEWGWRYDITMDSPTETDRLKTRWKLTIGGQMKFQDMQLSALQQTVSYQITSTNNVQIKLEAKSSDGTGITARSWMIPRRASMVIARDPATGQSLTWDPTFVATGRKILIQTAEVSGIPPWGIFYVEPFFTTGSGTIETGPTAALGVAMYNVIMQVGGQTVQAVIAFTDTGIQLISYQIVG